MQEARGSVDAAAVLAGRYRLIEQIGRGGLADVWRAEDTTLGRQVAVKVWSSPDTTMDGAAAGAWQEARDAARLIHPHVARVYDIGADRGQLFLVTELVPGQDLEAVLAQSGPLPAVRVAQIGAQVARVLAAAHAQGLVHGGLKPGNLLIAADGTVKLTDFGTATSPGSVTGVSHASAIGPDDASGPAAGSGRRPAAGSSAAYISPEQAVGLPAGPATDLYALGCVLYELLVGRPPFTDDGDNTDDSGPALRRHVEDEPAPPGRLRAGIPAEMEYVVLRMLAKNPADRPAGADRIAEIFQTIEAVQALSDI